DRHGQPASVRESGELPEAPQLVFPGRRKPADHRALQARSNRCGTEWTRGNRGSRSERSENMKTATPKKEIIDARTDSRVPQETYAPIAADDIIGARCFHCGQPAISARQLDREEPIFLCIAHAAM